MIDVCDHLKAEFNCTVILIHHTGVSLESKERARGSSAWRAAMDFEFHVKRNENMLLMKCMKMKDSGEPQQIGFKSEIITLDGISYDNNKDVTSLILKYEGEVAQEASPIQRKNKNLNTGSEGRYHSSCLL